MSFLKAEWKNLAIANYEVNPHLLKKWIPSGTVLDLWQGRCYVSLIGFMFENTKVLGLKIPFYINFEEVNLRFYVKCFQNQQWKRGVVFIKEIVPKKALAFIANAVYKEHYQALPMKHSSQELEGSKIVNYSWEINGSWHGITVKSNLQAKGILENSEAEFITEHYWGYTKVNDHKTFEYEVVHPKWKIYDVQDYEIRVDFATVYGNEFKNLNFATPQSVMLAEGSEIKVKNKKALKMS
ncbi:MAG: DUF2071 domain-containing protein [Bacteroidota bacterium]|nr:DUF2071 domain-containing protein [Bacteroidota bacterium]